MRSSKSIYARSVSLDLDCPGSQRSLSPWTYGIVWNSLACIPSFGWGWYDRLELSRHPASRFSGDEWLSSLRSTIFFFFYLFLKSWPRFIQPKYIYASPWPIMFRCIRCIYMYVCIHLSVSLSLLKKRNCEWRLNQMVGKHSCSVYTRLHMKRKAFYICFLFPTHWVTEKNNKIRYCV